MTRHLPLAYPIEQEPIILSKQLWDILLQEDEPTDLIGLYGFYYYTAKWQRSSLLHATTEYAAKHLKWTEKRVQKNKRRLIALDLLEDVVQYDQENRITGHFILIRFACANDPVTVSKPQVYRQPVVCTPTGAEVLKEKKEQEERKEEEKKKRKNYFVEKEKKQRNIIPPKLAWVYNYCQERKSPVNPKTFFDWHTAKGWKIGKDPMRDWQAALRTWEQRNGQSSNGNGHKPPIYDDGRKYIWDTQRGIYVHSVSGEIYIP